MFTTSMLLDVCNLGYLLLDIKIRDYSMATVFNFR